MSSLRHVRLMKCLDNLLGKLAVQLILAPRRPLSNPVPRKILIIRPGGIGDAVLLIPVIRILKNTFPEMDITILAEKRNSAVFSFCPEITGVISYDSPKDLLAAVRGKFDAVIDTEQWHCLSAVMARLVRSSLKIGYGTNMRRKLFTHMIDYSHNDYEINSFLNLLSPLGVVQPKVPEYPFIHIPANIAHSVTAMLKPLSGRDFVTLFPGASTVEKRWDEGKFIALSKNLSEKGIVVVIVGSDSEKLIGEKIIASGCGLNLAGRTSLIESAAVIQRSSLLISGDSGLLHIAVGLGVPTVSLFGPSNTSKWAPKGARHIIVSGNLPCSPCSKFGYTPQCPINVKCMADIAEEEVVAAVEKLLGKFQIGSAHDSI